MEGKFKYLVYDIETAIDKPLLNKVLYSGEGLDDNAAYQKQLAELAEEDRDFVNPSFHKPISMAAIAVADDLQITKIGLLGGEKRTASSIVHDFWEIYNTKQPHLVDFNGKGFDLRILELWAFRLGITIHKKHFDKYGVRYKFSDESHLDLHEFLTNHGAIRFKGGLNLFSKLLGKPGKTTTKGVMVQELYEKGEFFRIDDYCLADTMDTYFVFLRTRVMVGELSLSQEKELVQAAREKLEAKAKKEGYFKEYLEFFGEWVPEN
ncbi:MAG: 3'-5' exonuclease [Deltaproteobacteria bacterium]|nr:3'-5' exonuclease [Deltaproteobacteria bacterium]